MRGRIWWIVGAVAILVVAAAGLTAYLSATQFRDLAYQGKANATAAVKALSADQPEVAASRFEQARDEFSRARGLLGPEWLQSIPWLGRQLAAADDLATIGLEGSSAGVEGLGLLAAVQEVPAGEDRFSAIIRLAGPRLESALTSLAEVAQRSRGLGTEGLQPDLAEAVSEVRDVLEPMHLLLDRSESLLQLQRHLFSGEHRFLLVAQNSSELRPTGGFMGTYGLIQFGPEGFEMESFADIYTLPRDTLDEPLPSGGQVNYKHFYFRNTNWWMDFPTSAAMILKFWENLRQPPVDGIIAIDIPLLQELLKVYGPITVPESSKPLTAENVMEQLNYVVQYVHGGAGPNKKSAIVSLVAEVMRRLTSLDAPHFEPTVEALSKAANEKHLQVFLTDPVAQAAMVTAGWSGAIAAPEGTTDLLAVSNGVIKPSKANLGVTKTLDYQVSLAADRSADTTLSLGYRKSPKLQQGVPQQWLANYVRAHRAAGTELLSGPGGFESLVDATGLPTFAHYFRLDPGKSTKVGFRSKVPAALVDDSSRPGVQRYRLLLVKQADLVNTEATLAVSAPQGWRIDTASAVLRASGAQVAARTTETRVEVTTPLKQDIVLEVTIARR